MVNNLKDICMRLISYKLIDLNKYIPITEYKNLLDTKSENINLTQIMKINDQFKFRRELFLLKNTKPQIYEKIRKIFRDITCKNFDVLISTEIQVEDYKYCIVVDENNYECSYGECELINFIIHVYL